MIPSEEKETHDAAEESSEAGLIGFANYLTPLIRKKNCPACPGVSWKREWPDPALHAVDERLENPARVWNPHGCAGKDACWENQKGEESPWFLWLHWWYDYPSWLQDKWFGARPMFATRWEAAGEYWHGKQGGPGQHEEVEVIEMAETNNKNGNERQNEDAEMATQDEVEIIDGEEQENAKMNGKDGDVQQNENAEEKAEEEKDPPKDTEPKQEVEPEKKEPKMEKGDKVEQKRKKSEQKADAKQKAKKDAKKKAKKDAKQKVKKDAKQKAKNDAKQKAKKDAKQDDVKMQEKQMETNRKNRTKKQTEDQIKKKLHSVPWLSYIRLA